MVKIGQTLLALQFLFATASGAPKGGIAEKEAEYYRIITIPTPEGITFEAGALCFLAPDRLACSTRFGDIWIADGVMGDPPKPKWTLFASGLHEVLGLTVRPGEKDGWIYCTQRGEVTRMRDENGDGRADVFETVSDGWGINGDYHEYAFGSKFDREGNIWIVLCLTGSFDSKSLYRGWALKVTPDGQTIPVGAGVRSPGGIGFNAAGDLFYTDNQGPWNGACKLQQIIPGAFLGHPDGLRWFEQEVSRDVIAKARLKRPAKPQDKSRLYLEAKKIPELLPPAVYFPYNKMGQSAGGFAFNPTADKFGPFKDQLFVGDQTQSIVMRTTLEKIGGHYQGACYPFRAGFDSGCLGMEFAHDGSLFVYGTDRGWGSRGGKPFALQRLVWTGKVPFEIAEMSARADGFELIFTEPVDAATAAAPASYKMETYTYVYQASYGSPEVDQTKPAIKSATVSPDGYRVRLVLSELAEGHVHELHATGLRSRTGAPLLHDTAYYTLFYIPKS
jgi:hypothetical protein